MVYTWHARAVNLKAYFTKNKKRKKLRVHKYFKPSINRKSNNNNNVSKKRKMRKNYPSTNKNNLIKLENICRSRNVPQAVNTLNEQHAHYPAFVLRVTNVNVCMHTYILVHMALTHINCLSHIGREASAADTKSGMKKTHLNVGVRVCATRVTILCTRILIPESGI